MGRKPEVRIFVRISRNSKADSEGRKSSRRKLEFATLISGAPGALLNPLRKKENERTTVVKDRGLSIQRE
jgi:hypothetical protein